MVAKIRKLTFSPAFPQTHSTKFTNLLVSGGSYVWNNSEDHVCTWPYVLKDLAGFQEVHDCSQSGAGPTHVFNSIINEIETNKNLNSDNTTIIVMLSDMSITDTITTNSITKSWHHMSNYNFNDQFSTLTLFKEITHKGSSNSSLEKLCVEYAKHIDFDAQVYENLIKIKALHAYLNAKNFQTIYLHWNTAEIPDLNNYVDQIESLDHWTQHNNMRIPGDRHPTPEAHLTWTRNILVPYLEDKKLIDKI